MIPIGVSPDDIILNLCSSCFGLHMFLTALKFRIYKS